MIETLFNNYFMKFTYLSYTFKVLNQLTVSTQHFEEFKSSNSNKWKSWFQVNFLVHPIISEELIVKL
jgi:hypothetical protein